MEKSEKILLIAQQLAAWRYDETPKEIKKIWNDDDEITGEARRRFMGQAKTILGIAEQKDDRTTPQSGHKGK